MKKDFNYWSLFISIQIGVSMFMMSIGITWLSNYFLAGYIIGDEMERIYKWIYGE